MNVSAFITPVTASRRQVRTLLVGALAGLLAIVGLPPSAADALVDFQDFVVSDNPAGETPYVLDGAVYAIEEVGNLIVVGGSFSQIQNVGGGVVNQGYLFAFDRDTGVIDPSFSPALNNTVEALVPAEDGFSVYVGGRFNSVNGTTRRNLARLDTRNGSVLSGFQANTNSRVNDLQLRGDRLYVAGAFSTIKGNDRSLLAAVDPQTGDVLPDVDHSFTDPYGGNDGNGSAQILKFDVSPDNTRLVAVGNFGTVDGQDHDHIVQLDVAANPSVVYDWSTPRYTQTMCASVFDTYMRDVQISPDGAYFNVNTTGAYRSNQLCDTSVRWELAASGSNQQPTWITYTGGDTLYANALTGEAIYIGGHQRWVNNNYAGDRAGPGAVPREGLAALSPVSGLPYSWDPGRQRGVGVFDMLTADEGIYMGSNTQRWAGEYHPRLALFPDTGGGAGPIPEAAPGPLPGELLQAPRYVGQPNPAYLYRVNAGGPALGSSDGGIDWAADQASTSPLRNTGSNAAGYGTVPTVSNDVPESTPREVYSSERWDPGSAPEMSWDFPVDLGRDVQVRLYLGNRCTCTDGPGERVFDVAIDGDTVLDNLDLSADLGHDVGGVYTFPVTSDGNIDIDWGHVTENPLVNAIEIVDPALVDQPFDTSTTMETQDATTTNVGAASQVGAGIDWSTTRGAWMLSGTLYYGSSDGNLYARDFDGTNFGPEEQLDLYGLSAQYFPVSQLSGATFDPYTKRLYYTVEGSGQLYWRHFEPESRVVASEGFTAQSNIAGLDWRDVRGLHLDVESGTLLYGNVDGVLRSVDFTDGQAVPGTIATVADADGGSWQAGGITAYSDASEAVPNRAPKALVTATCDEADCLFGSVGSSDQDGTIRNWAWDFGDGQTATGPGASHTFASGTWEVTLTVTDEDGATGTDTTVVTVEGAPPVAPEAEFTVDCEGVSCTFDASASSDVDSTITDYDWDFGDGTTDSGEVVVHDYDTDEDFVATLTVTDAQGLDDTATKTVTLSRAPTASFTVDCTELSCTFDASASSDLAGDITSWTWDFGGDGNDVGEVVTHDFSAAGDYDVVLTVTDEEGLSGEETQTVTVDTAPVAPTASFTFDCIDLSCSFDGSGSMDDDGTVVDWAWDFDDGSADSGEQVDHEFPASGSYAVTLTVTDSQGLTDETTQDVMVEGAPVAPEASFTVDCTDLMCSFDGTGSSDADGTVDGWAWDFGDNTSGTGDVVEHDYATDGTYDVTLTVTDNDQMTGQATQSVTVSEGGVGENIAFIGVDTEVGNQTVFTADVPDGTQMGDALLLYASVNRSNVTVGPPGGVTGWTEVGVTTSGSIQTIVWAKAAESADLGQTVSVDVTQRSKGTLTLVSYSGTNETDPVHAFDMVGEAVYRSSHTSPEVVSEVEGAWVVSHWADKTSGTTDWSEPAGETVRAEIFGSGSGRVTSLLTDSGPVSAGTQGGLTATANESNQKATMSTLVLEPATSSPPGPQAPVAAFTVDCTDLSCSFDGSGSSDTDGTVQSWDWAFGDQTGDTGAQVNHTYGDPGTYQVTLTVTDNQGLQDEVTQSVSVDEAGVAGDIAFVGARTEVGNQTGFGVDLPDGIAAGDAMVMFLSVNRSGVTVGPIGGTTGWTELGMVESGSMQTSVWTKVVQGGDVGGAVTVDVSERTKGNLSVLAYEGTDTTSPVALSTLVDETVYRFAHTTPQVESTVDGARILSYWADKTSGTTDWSEPAGETVRAEDFGSGGGHISSLVTDNGGPVGPGTYGGLTATANESNQKATMATLVLQPAG